MEQASDRAQRRGVRRSSSALPPRPVSERESGRSADVADFADFTEGEPQMSPMSADGQKGNRFQPPRNARIAKAGSEFCVLCALLRPKLLTERECAEGHSLWGVAARRKRRAGGAMLAPGWSHTRYSRASARERLAGSGRAEALKYLGRPQARLGGGSTRIRGAETFR